MDENKKKQIDRWITVISMGGLAIVFAYILYILLVIKNVTKTYYIVIVAGLLFFWLMTDVVSIILKKDFEGHTKKEIRAYQLYALLELIGYAGLGFFAFTMQRNTSLFGAVAYLLTMTNKKRFLDEYHGIVEEDEDDYEEEEETEAIETEEEEETETIESEEE